MTVHYFNSQSFFPQRIAIFVDMQNVFYSAKNIFQSKINFKKLMEIIVGQRELIRAIAYIVQRPEIDQSGFMDLLNKFGYEVKTKELRVRNDGTAKGDWDMAIAIDSIAIAEKVDTIVLVSGDGDFVPLVEMLKARGCRVEVVAFPSSTSNDLINSSSLFIPIEESLLFKETKKKDHP
ncbi:NYN domain-containing protein [bacterium]|nr:NYN domain-containing protein [bacterium]MCP5462102.1 NYN domain-containing protein [bacterium]